MRTRLISGSVAMAMLLFAGVSASARTVVDKKTEDLKDEDVRARIWLNKGGERVLDGYLRSPLVNRPDHV